MISHHFSILLASQHLVFCPSCNAASVSIFSLFCYASNFKCSHWKFSWNDYYHTKAKFYLISPNIFNFMDAVSKFCSLSWNITVLQLQNKINVAAYCLSCSFHTKFNVCYCFWKYFCKFEQAKCILNVICLYIIHCLSVCHGLYSKMNNNSW